MLVTHDHEEARLADAVVRMEAGRVVGRERSDEVGR